MEKIILTLFVLASAVTADETINMKGNVNEIVLNGSGCSFKINNRSSPSLVSSLRFCHLLFQAYNEKQALSIQVEISSGSNETNNYEYSISFPDSPATWPSAETKYESRTFKYQLVGKVSDVKYYTQSSKCYIAIDTGLPVRNNNVYHFAENYDLCDIAVGAFYSKDTVSMMASVDLNAGYANDVLDLKVAFEKKCCQ